MAKNQHHRSRNLVRLGELKHGSIGLFEGSNQMLEDGKVRDRMPVHLWSKRFRSVHVLICFLLGVVTVTAQGHADAIISGSPCVIDGNTIQVGGKLRDGKCWGGINVRLLGIVAPNAEESCRNSKGEEWACGEVATRTLRSLIRNSMVACYHAIGESAEQTLSATCISGRIDLASGMVRRGFAQVVNEFSARYLFEESEAKKLSRGIWK